MNRLLQLEDCHEVRTLATKFRCASVAKGRSIRRNSLMVSPSTPADLGFRRMIEESLIDVLDWGARRSVLGESAIVPSAIRDLLSGSSDAGAEEACWRLDNRVVVQGQLLTPARSPTNLIPCAKNPDGRWTMIAKFDTTGAFLEMKPLEYGFLYNTLSYVLNGIRIADHDFRNILGMSREDAENLFDIIKAEEDAARSRHEHWLRPMPEGWAAARHPDLVRNSIVGRDVVGRKVVDTPGGASTGEGRTGPQEGRTPDSLAVAHMQDESDPLQLGVDSLKLPTPDDLGNAPVWENYITAQATQASLGQIPVHALAVGVQVDGVQVRLRFQLSECTDDDQADIDSIVSALEALVGQDVHVGVSSEIRTDAVISRHDGASWIFAVRP